MYLLVPLFYSKVLAELGRFQRCIGRGQEMREKFAIIQNAYVACILLMVLFMIGLVLFDNFILVLYSHIAVFVSAVW